ncbi:hypothetical protein HNR02_000710 [Amycolatopsis endophytica]|uniref:Uncharacterized protein n=1 Tax=Amycolatopsis endophytica TaxID=860233 RepID=A0A853AXM2_9PSEU|nr:hypothetical protein [Amycolatopsis endophytica]NYI87387.1 hypothetical protein [Amycolatopsis endophytica]
MAKKFGKKKKPAQLGDLFGAPPPPPRPGPPASSTPLGDYLAQGLPGVDEGYVVLPRSLAESMSLPWQQQLAGLLAQFHQTHRSLNWPVYRTVPSRHEKLTDLDEEQLAEVGYLVEIDADGDMIYRERSGRKVEEPENTTVLVPCLDPIPHRGQARSQPDAPAPQPEAPRAAPINLPPAPVWRTTPTAPSPEVPPLPEPPKKLAAPRTPPEPGQSPTQSGQPAAGPPAGGPPGPGQPAAAPSPPRAAPAQPSSAQPAAAQPVRNPQAWRTMDAPEPPPRFPEPLPPQPQPTPAAGIPLGRTGDPETTPPQGIPRSDRDWFEEDPAEQGFGPTGQPTELPYRYRP